MVLHSVPPVVVFVAAEAVTDLRDKLTDAVHVAVSTSMDRTQVHEPPVAEPAATVAEVARPERRKLFADYLADARAVWSAEVEITPAWVREATGCSRGLSSRLAAALAAEVAEGVRHDQ
ncbi:hypothetical protein H4W30_000007 [Amycolatopsis roodepoortensis]|uniref:Uncharacterized protein n=1 Tax=Amycolatopsis roodepoortensis TaxID=700274 RepID=A0ABR9KX73_9PSEU|nr:hypothetical protein [Amycolatopsis roodepoortensis]